ncbi:uncharacterized protein LOC134530291 [Bacillus rossius redtenbacheri]|uniref:uncharacterized protein LOC134530291 n=1 Tax=Bacillus rossius redtenbacheri TaxID=93214 RepID=UPI002FDCA67C
MKSIIKSYICYCSGTLNRHVFATFLCTRAACLHVGMDVCLLGDCRTPLTGPAAKDILLPASRPGPPTQQRPSRLLPALHGAVRNATGSRKTYMAARRRVRRYWIHATWTLYRDQLYAARLAQQTLRLSK